MVGFGLDYYQVTFKYKIDKYHGLVLHPNCVPEKVGVNQTNINKKWHSLKKKSLRRKLLNRRTLH